MYSNNEKLAQTQHAFYQRLIRRMHIGSLAQVTLAGLALLSEKVLLKSLGTLDFSRAGNLESLLRAAVGLELRHGGLFSGRRR